MTARIRAVSIVASVCALSGLYLLFVVHFSENVPRFDDWTEVWIVSQAIAGHLTWHDLWTLHNANRMLVPNLAFVVIGEVTRENLRAVNIVGALVFIGTFALFLRLVHDYRRLTAPLVVTVGVVWFSVADWGSALWSFQLAWYLILLFFVLMLWLLDRPSAWALAILCAVAASFCSIEGLFLWPVGLLWILWKKLDGWIAWCVAAVITGVVYFVGYESAPPYLGHLFPSKVLGQTGSTSSLGYVFHHPGQSAQFVLAEVGNVLPIGGNIGRYLLGAALLSGALFVLIRSWREEREALPVALIAVALIFDAFLASGRSNYGVAWAQLSQYTMDNLLLLIALVLYAWKHFSPRWVVAWVVLFVVVISQVISSTNMGVTSGNASVRLLRTEARFVTTTDLVPPTERHCYSVFGLFDYVLPDLSPSFVAQLRYQQLTVFAPDLYRAYRAEGLPMLPQCRKP